jgi:Fe-S cluster biosynthesis and repair protein YggX
MVNCVKLNKEAEGLERKPYPGDLGQRIYDSICKEAWQQWMGQQTILINEHRINVMDPKGRAFLEEQMEKFFFDGGADIPAGFTPPVK